jgi:hypothetical protein
MANAPLSIVNALKLTCKLNFGCHLSGPKFNLQVKLQPLQAVFFLMPKQATAQACMRKQLSNQ